MTLIQEKVNQAIDILKEQETDLWLTFVRETSGVRDPALDFLIGPGDLTWSSALDSHSSWREDCHHWESRKGCRCQIKCLR